MIHLSSSYLQSLLFEAEQHNIELHVDINSIENKFFYLFFWKFSSFLFSYSQVIEQLKMLEKQGSNINDLTKGASLSKKVSRLPSIGVILIFNVFYLKLFLKKKKKIGGV